MYIKQALERSCPRTNIIPPPKKKRIKQPNYPEEADVE